MLYELFTSKRVTSSIEKEEGCKSDKSIEKKIEGARFVTNYGIEEEEVKQWKHILRHCLKNNPKERWSSSQLLKEVNQRIFQDRMMESASMLTLERYQSLKADLHWHISNMKESIDSKKVSAGQKMFKMVET